MEQQENEHFSFLPTVINKEGNIQLQDGSGYIFIDESGPELEPLIDFQTKENGCITTSNSFPEDKPTEIVSSIAIVSSNHHETGNIEKKSSVFMDIEDRRSDDKPTGFTKSSSTLEVIEESPCENERKQFERLQMEGLSRQRSPSLQIIQNFFNIKQKYKCLASNRRPSDVVEERRRKTDEEAKSPPGPKISDKKSTGGRRFSDNFLAKRKRMFFRGGFNTLIDYLSERNSESTQEQELSASLRDDVCPIFQFPQNADQDEVILDLLRQATRKCTMINPNLRPTSHALLQHLTKLT